MTVLLFVGLLAPARAETVEALRIPMAAAGPDGLEAVLVEPTGPGRHPLAIISHGSPRDAADRAGMSARGMLAQASDFAKLGFVAVAVLRRGYGSSGGGWAESFGPCDHPDYVKAGRAGAADLRAAISALSKRPEVDSTKILAVGVSAGGFATVAVTADPPPGLVAAISFAGGRGSQGPDNVCEEGRLVDAFRTFGATSRVPMLWVYAENDHFFGPTLARRLQSAFTGAGGKVQFVAAAAFGDEGHFLFSPKGRPIWLPIVETFLAREGFAGQGFAGQGLANQDAGGAPRADGLVPPHQLRASARQDFQTFLDAAPHKAFAVSADGAYAWRTARDTVEAAEDDALRNCRREAHGSPCHLYAVDDGYAP